MSHVDNIQSNARISWFWAILFGFSFALIITSISISVMNYSAIQDANALLSSYEISTDTLSDDEITLRELADMVGRIQSAEERALNYLSIFESIAFWVSVISISIVSIGFVTAVLGFSNFRELRKELEATEKQFRQSADNFRNLEDTFQNQLTEEIQISRTAWLLTSLAERTLTQGNLESALHSLERAFELDKFNPLPSYYLGYIALNTRKEEQAKDYFEKAIEIDPNYYQALAALGFTLRRIGEKQEDSQIRTDCFKKAEKLLLQALGNDHSLVDFEGESWHGSLAGLYRRTERLHEAKHHYRLARNVTPLSSYPAGNLALIAIQSGSKDEDINTLYEDVYRLAGLEIRADTGNYWAQADLLTAILVLGDSEDQVIQIYRNLLDSIPRLVFDVLPRVLDTLEEIKIAPSYEGDKRNKTLIETVLKRLREEIDSKQATI